MFKHFAPGLLWIVFCAVVPLSAQSTSLPASGAVLDAARAATLTTAVLTPGDAIRIEVWRQPELSGEFKVGADGYIRHPLYRGVQVTGVPLSTVEERLRTFLTQFSLTPQFMIEPLMRVSVSGEVRQPRLYTLSPETTVADAVALAGGPTERGRMDRVRLVRDGSVRVADLTLPQSGMATTPVHSGDQIIIPRHRSTFRETIAPVATITAAAAAVLNVILRYRD